MHLRHLSVCVVAFALATAATLFCESFATFPEKKELPSPDGRFVLRSIDFKPAPNEISGVFHSLVLEEPATGRSRKIYDYVRRVAVAWSTNERFIVTDYLNGKSSRVMVFNVSDRTVPITLDKLQLARLLTAVQSPHLTGNDHVYVEASKLNGNTLTLRVWGYGTRDVNGFHLTCNYDLEQGTAACQ